MVVSALVDSHCHLDCINSDAYPGGLNGVLANARQHGIDWMLTACVSLDEFPKILAIVEQQQHIVTSVGIQPSEQPDFLPTVAELVNYAKHPSVVAIGEVGLDYHYEHVTVELQQERFRCHIHAAKQAKLPLIIHTRAANKDLLKIMHDEGANEVGGVMHCFTEDWDMAKQCMDLGFYISFSGIVTFKNANALREVAKQVPLDKMLIETDAPYLAPVPYRGQPNQPAFLAATAEFLAELRNIKIEQLASQTTKNFFDLFSR